MPPPRDVETGQNAAVEIDELKSEMLIVAKLDDHTIEVFIND